jgi:hypothetical protein
MPNVLPIFAIWAYSLIIDSAWFGELLSSILLISSAKRLHRTYSHSNTWSVMRPPSEFLTGKWFD